MKDSHGFMWFATRAGLCRYDGYMMKVFQYNPDDSTSLSDNYVRSTLVEDTCGYIWVGTLDGLNKLDPISEQFIRYNYNPENPHSISSNRIRCTYLDSNGVVWIGTESKGLNRYNLSTDNFDSYLPSPDFKLSNTVNGIYEDQTGLFWISTTSGLYQFDRSSGEFMIVKQLAEKGEWINNRFSDITEDNEGNLWYCADRIYIFSKANRELVHFQAFNDSLIGNPNPRYMDILLDPFDNKQTLWIARNGLYKFDLLSKNMTVIHNDQSDPDNFTRDNPGALYRDPSGLLWIATISGIRILDPKPGQIQAHHEFAKRFDNDAISFLKDSKGHVWIGTYTNGLIHYDENMRLLYWYKPSKSQDEHGSFYGFVRMILEDSDNNIWILCQRDGVYLLDRNNNEFVRCKLMRFGKDIKPTSLFDIYEDAQGTLWVCGPGLFFREKGTFEPTTFHMDTNNKTLRSYSVTEIDEDHSGNLWIASFSGGLLRHSAYGRESGGFYEFTHDPDDPNSLSNNHVWSVYVDDHGEIWTGTNQGLNRYMDEKDCFEKFLVDYESGESFIYDMVRDRNGYLWLTTEQGLIRFNPPDQGRFNNIRNQIKLKTKEVNIVTLVNGYVQSFESLAKQKKIDLIFNYDEENIQLFVDKDKIEKILFNLLSNAYKFTGEGGRIIVRIASTDTARQT